MSEKTTNTPPKYKRSPALNASIILVFLSIVLLITLAMFVSFDEVTNRFEAGKVDIVLTEPHWDPKNGEETVPNTFIDKDPTIFNKEDTVNTYVFLEVIVPYEDCVGAIIEKPYQDDQDHAGSVGHQITSGEKIPYYKFVATNEPVTNDNYTTANLYDYYDHDYTSTQNVNSRWLLLDGYPLEDFRNKTFTYIYAYVQENDNTKLEPLLAGTKTSIPLFNKIYVLNFRERAKVEDPNTHTVTVTPFPDPSRDYSIRINAYGIQANFLRPNNETTTNPQAVWNMLNPNYSYTETEPAP